MLKITHSGGGGKFFPGDTLRLAARFVSEETTNEFDPTTVRVIYRSETDNETILTYGVNAEVVKDTVGKYHFNLVPDVAGDWFYRWESEGPNEAEEKRFPVKDTFVFNRE